MPLNTALRNTFFLPKIASNPGGQAAKINQIAATIATTMINDQTGWRSMNRFMRRTAEGARPGRRSCRRAAPLDQSDKSSRGRNAGETRRWLGTSPASSPSCRVICDKLQHLERFCKSEGGPDQVAGANANIGRALPSARPERRGSVLLALRVGPAGSADLSE